MGRTFPPTCLPGPRALSPVPICCLPLSQWGQPLVPSSSLPATHFLPAAQRYRNTHAELSLCVCECVCVSVRPHPRACTWRGASEPGGAVKAATPELMSSSTPPPPPASLPSALPLRRGAATRYFQKAREGAILGTPWSVLHGETKAGARSVPHPFLASPCTEPQGPPWSELLAWLLAPHDMSLLTLSTLPRGYRCWERLTHVSPFISCSTGITVGWAYRTLQRPRESWPWPITLGGKERRWH